MMSPHILLILLCPTLLLQGCSHTYDGDGRFVDHGIRNPSVRYSLILPDFDLCKKETYRFRVGRLPSSWWEGEFSYSQRGMELADAEKTGSLIETVSIKMKVLDRKSGEIFHEYAGPLKDVSEGLPGSTYGGGLSVVGHVFGLYDPKNIFGFPVGTYSEREIVISIVEPLPDLQPHCEAHLVVSNGGWK
jgi:hypothetical protein